MKTNALYFHFFKWKLKYRLMWQYDDFFISYNFLRGKFYPF